MPCSTTPPNSCPRRRPRSAGFKTRFDAIAEKAKAPFKIGHDTPGLARGRQLKPEELDQMAEGAKLMAEVDQETMALIKDIVSFGTALLDDNAKAARSSEPNRGTRLR